MSNGSKPVRTVRIEAGDRCLVGQFFAMGSPCELLVDTDRRDETERLTNLVAAEAWRIEDKLSRYIEDNAVDRINRSNGQPVELDEETSQLIDFAETLYELSEHRFDITSGVLRRVWTFDGSGNIPEQSAIDTVIQHVGWHHVTWNRPSLQLPAGMEIDLGGIGKEYAVDRCTSIYRSATELPGLLNYGGDLSATRAPIRRDSWAVGIEATDPVGRVAERMIRLSTGALATSGDARRFLIRNGIRYGHILDPTTGWPVQDAPRSITVAADTCTQAGMLSTLAMLKGRQAEAFLKEQGVQFWCIR